MTRSRSLVLRRQPWPARREEAATQLGAASTPGSVGDCHLPQTQNATSRSTGARNSEVFGYVPSQT